MSQLQARLEDLGTEELTVLLFRSFEPTLREGLAHYGKLHLASDSLDLAPGRTARSIVNT